MRVTALGRLWRTARHLRVEQVAGRILIRFRRPRPQLAPAPPRRPTRGPWQPPAERAASLYGQQRFEFLSLSHELPVGANAWNDPALSHLWRYNLHYFDDLNATGAAQRRSAQRALIERWCAENPPGQGTGWEPYPTSLRIVNWIKCFVGGEPAEAAWLQSLAVQTRWLQGRLERHLLGNHLFANAKALLASGLFFDGPEAENWQRLGLRLLERELPEQVLADGGQFERSPMYQALALEDLLDLINLIRALGDGTPSQMLLEPLQKRARTMLHWLRCMVHPDATLAHFNDGADGIAPPPIELERYAFELAIAAARPTPCVLALPDSGYVRAAWSQALLLADLAPLGPDYLLGHAHADTLSFELSLGRRRVVVNGGTSRYGLGPERLRERGTAAHSTVQVAGHDSSEVWSGFRVGRRARVQEINVGDSAFGATHDGYRWLPGSPRHRRDWRLEPGGLTIDDRVEPAAPALARFHLAPGLALQPLDSTRFALRDGVDEVAQVEVVRGMPRIEPSQHAPRFGITLPTEALVVELDAGCASTRWSWNADAYPLSY